MIKDINPFFKKLSIDIFMVTPDHHSEDSTLEIHRLKN